MKRRRVSDFAPVTGWEAALALAALVLFSIAMSLLLGPDPVEGAEPVIRPVLQLYSVTAHSGDHEYEDQHPGLGLEIQVSPDAESPWNLGVGGHYMVRDSNGHPCWWAGVTPSYTIGNRAGFWLEPGVILGVGRKAGLYKGEIGPGFLPKLGLGYGAVGVDLFAVPSEAIAQVSGNQDAPAVWGGMVRVGVPFKAGGD